MVLTKLLILSIFIVILSILIPQIYLIDKEIPYNDIQHKEFTPNMLKINAITPLTIINTNNSNNSNNSNNDSNYNFGRYSNPILYPNLHNLNIIQKIFQKKEWHFIAINDGSLLIGMAVANLGYIETSFIYFCDTKNNIHDKISFVLPGGSKAAVVSPSSIDSETCSTFSSSLTNFKVSICYVSSSNSWKLVGNGVLENKSSISFDINLKRTGFDEFSLVYPLGPNRGAYTHKTSSLYAEGTHSLSLSGQSQQIISKPFIGTGLTDYSRTLARTFTEWFWIAFSFQQTQQQNDDELNQSKGNGLHGIQLSQGVYRYPTFSKEFNSNNNENNNNDNNNQIEHGDLENIIWTNQKPFYLDSILRFTIYDPIKQETVSILPGQNQVKLNNYINITSDDKRISLTYYPLSQLPTELSTPIFSGRLYHTYGVYSGYIIGSNNEKVEFNNIPGVFEDHYAKW